MWSASPSLPIQPKSLYGCPYQPRWQAGAMSWLSGELERDAPERAEICAHGVALLRPHHTRERAGEYEVALLQRDAVLTQLIGEPRDAHRWMAEHAGGHTRFLDLGIAHHDAADPAQIDIHRTDRTAADHDAGGSAVVRDRVEDLARVDEPRVDDLDRRNDVLGRAQHIGQADAWTFQLLAKDERELDLDARRAIVLVS